MVDAVGRRWQSGQATLEHVGLVLVLALAFGALGTWVVRGFPMPSAPSGMIERVVAPMAGGPGASRAPGDGAAAAEHGASDPLAPTDGAAAAAHGASHPLAGMARAMERSAVAGATAQVATEEGAASAGGRDAGARDGGGPGVLRRAWDGLLWWGALNVDGQIEAGKGFLEQVGVRAEDLVKDPIKTVEGAIDRLSKPPVTSTADRVANIVRALSGIGDRPFRESFLEVSRDLGGLGADWLIAKYARGAGELLGRLLGG